MRQGGTGDGGLLSALRSGGVWFDLTTLDPGVVETGLPGHVQVPKVAGPEPSATIVDS